MSTFCRETYHRALYQGSKILVVNFKSSTSVLSEMYGANREASRLAAEFSGQLAPETAAALVMLEARFQNGQPPDSMLHFASEVGATLLYTLWTEWQMIP